MYILQDKKTGRYLRDRIDDRVEPRMMLDWRWVDDVAEATAYKHKHTAKTMKELLSQYNLKIIERN